MTSVMDSGTGRSAKLSGMPCAGKTGTTNDHKDGWFCGFTRYYTTAVWVGCDYPKSIQNLSGSTYPAQIWKTYMTEIHKNLAPMDFLPYAQLSDDFKDQKASEQKEHDQKREENKIDENQEDQKETDKKKEETKEEKPKDSEKPSGEESGNEKPSEKPDNTNHTDNTGETNNNENTDTGGDETGGNEEQPDNGGNTGEPGEDEGSAQ